MQFGMETLFTTLLNHQRFDHCHWFFLVFCMTGLWHVDGFQAIWHGNLRGYPGTYEKSWYHFVETFSRVFLDDRESSYSVCREQQLSHDYKKSLCVLHEHALPQHARYNLEFFYQSRICLFVVFSLFTSFCRDTSCQVRPFCKENIVPLYNLSGSNPSKVNSRGIMETLFPTLLNYQRFDHFHGFLLLFCITSLWNVDGFHASWHGNLIHYPPESPKIWSFSLIFAVDLHH